MSFFGKFFGSSASAPAVPASLPPGWQEITVDGKKMYVSRTTNEISSTPPPPPSSATSLPYGWEKKMNEYGTYYAGPLTVTHATTTYRQNELPTWKDLPDTIRLSSDWEVFSSRNAKTYKNKKTNEITQNYPLAHGDDLQKILDDESAKTATESSLWNNKMHDSGYRGGLKNKSKRKQRKRKQSKRKQSKRK